MAVMTEPLRTLSVIAHEGGHSAHRQLMSANGVSPSYARGPHFLFESFSEFNELVLADFMAEHAATPELQRYYREQLYQGSRHLLWRTGCVAGAVGL